MRSRVGARTARIEPLETVVGTRETAGCGWSGELGSFGAGAESAGWQFKRGGGLGGFHLEDGRVRNRLDLFTQFAHLL